MATLNLTRKKNLGPNEHLHQPPTNILFLTSIYQLSLNLPSRRPKRCPKRRRVVLCVHRILHYFDLNTTASPELPLGVLLEVFWWKVSRISGLKLITLIYSIHKWKNPWILTIDPNFRPETSKRRFVWFPVWSGALWRDMVIRRLTYLWKSLAKTCEIVPHLELVCVGEKRPLYTGIHSKVHGDFSRIIYP